MKTAVSLTWIPGLIMVMAWLPGGLAQNNTNRPAPPADTPAAVFPGITTPKDFPALSLSAGDASVIKRQPPKIRLSPWTAEIVKLAESGIGDSVILSFIENSGTFNLGADQIVYLNDLGLSSEIVNAMLYHDRELITGAKPLTITSEPDWQTAFDSIFSVGAAVSLKPISKSTTIAPLASSASTEMANNPPPKTVPECGQAIPTQLALKQHAVADELPPLGTGAFGQRRQAKKSDPYRVREPYPEEITPPIIVVYGESPTPNTVVVVGFPRSAP